MAISSNDVWAVGDYYSVEAGLYRTLVERYSDPCLTPEPKVTPTATGTPDPTDTPTTVITPSPSRTATSTASPNPTCPSAWNDVLSPNPGASVNQLISGDCGERRVGRRVARF